MKGGAARAAPQKRPAAGPVPPADAGPLFTGWTETGDGRFCVAARAAPPFKPAPSARLRLRYTLCSSSDLRSANS